MLKVDLRLRLEGKLVKEVATAVCVWCACG